MIPKVDLHPQSSFFCLKYHDLGRDECVRSVQRTESELFCRSYPISVVLDRSRVHANRNAFVKAAVSARASNVLVDIAFALVLTNEGVLGNDGTSKKAVRCQL